MLEMQEIKKELLEAEKALEKFLHEHGGLTFGWPAKDHQAFLQLFLSYTESVLTDNIYGNNNNNHPNENDDKVNNKYMTHFNEVYNDQIKKEIDKNIKAESSSCSIAEVSFNLNTSKLIAFIARGLQHLHLPLEEIATHVERYEQYIKLSERVANLSNCLYKFDNKTSKTCMSNEENNKSKRKNKTLHEFVNCSKNDNNIEYTSSTSLLESALLLSSLQKVNNVPKMHSLLNKELKMHLASIASNYTQTPRPVLYITQTKMERERWAQTREDAKRKRNMLQERTLIKESNSKQAITEALWHEWHANNEENNKHAINDIICSVADNARISTTTSNVNASTDILLRKDICSDISNNKNVKTHRRATFDAPTASSAHRIFLSEKERHEQIYSKLFTDVEYSQSNVNQNNHELHSYSYT